ncbi:MAG: hypothetical protein IPP74_06515 [Alphaproteobacteria bacterium]|nr:hypothetical protein [Alphaproteobacteria bacterium]
MILEYFGDTCNPCGNCDTCNHPPRTFDATIPVQKALSCVYRTGQRFGVSYLIPLLVGVGLVALSAYNVYDAYKTNGALGALKAAGVELGMYMVGGVLVKGFMVAGKVYKATQAGEAFAAWLGSDSVTAKFVNNGGKTVATDAAAKNVSKISSNEVIWQTGAHAEQQLLERNLTKDQAMYVIDNGKQYFDPANNSIVAWIEAKLVAGYVGNSKLIGVAIDPAAKTIKTVMKRGSLNIDNYQEIF